MLMCYHDFQYVALILKAELSEKEELVAVGKSSSEKFGIRIPEDLDLACACT